MKKRILISPHQRCLHLPLGPLFSPIGQGWFRRIGARTILAPVTASSIWLVDNCSPEEVIFSWAFIFTKRMAIYINVNKKARIETKSILIYLITSLWQLYFSKNTRTPSLQSVPYRNDLIYVSVSTDPLACCHFVYYALFSSYQIREWCNMIDILEYDFVSNDRYALAFTFQFL